MILAIAFLAAVMYLITGRKWKWLTAKRAFWIAIGMSVLSLFTNPAALIFWLIIVAVAGPSAYPIKN